MIKNLLPTTLSKNFNLPKVTALMHTMLLAVLLITLICWAWALLGSDAIYSSMLASKALCMIAIGLLVGLNGLVYYLSFRLKKKPIAYSMCFAVVALQTIFISSGLSLV
jgi:hypothetical protein